MASINPTNSTNPINPTNSINPTNRTSQIDRREKSSISAYQDISRQNIRAPGYQERRRLIFWSPALVPTDPLIT
jgi:hypothetical protein